MALHPSAVDGARTRTLRGTLLLEVHVTEKMPRLAADASGMSGSM